MTRGAARVRRRPAEGGRALGRKRPGGVRAAKTAPRPRVRYTISVRDEQAHLSVTAGRIQRIARRVLAAEEVAVATVSVALVDNRAIHRLNRRHLHHDYETDVLSFLFESEGGCSAPKAARAAPRGKCRRIDGEVVVSAEMALRSAARFGWSAAEEMELYLVHGLLHLCGYDDGTDAERRLMRRRERAMLSLLGD